MAKVVFVSLKLALVCTGNAASIITAVQHFSTLITPQEELEFDH